MRGRRRCGPRPPTAAAPRGARSRLARTVVREIGERWATPERQGIPELRRSAGSARRASSTSRSNRDKSSSSGPTTTAYPGGRVGTSDSRRSEPGDVDLEGFRRRSGWIASPQLLNQAVGPDDLVLTEEQEREQRPFVAVSEPNRTVTVHDLERPENPELHCLRATLTRRFAGGQRRHLPGCWRARW